MKRRRLAARALVTAVASLFLAAPAASCRAPRTEVRGGSKKFTESVVLGEILAGMMRDAGVPAEHRAQLGGTQILWHALLQGDIDLYPDYTGTLRADILRNLPDASEESLREALARLDVGMSPSLGFEDRYALGMKSGEARRLGVARLSDLVAHPQLRLGFSEEFLNRADGWPLVRKRYGFPHKDVRPLDHDLAYRALVAGDIDVMDLYTTDAEIPSYDLAVLEDDLRAFPDYHAVVLYRRDLERRAPLALDAVRALAGRITASEMRRLNARVRMEHVPEPAAAAEFLTGTLHLTGGWTREGRAGRVGRALAEHLALVATSLLAAVLVATPLGIAAARRKRLGAVILGAAGVIQTIPTLALLVLLIPVLGIGALPAVTALFLYSMLPIVTGTMAGLNGIPEPLLESAEVLGLSRRARLRQVELPLASPSILAGIQTSAVICVGTATLGALIGAGGLGQPILTGIRLDDTRLILEGAVPAALLALTVQALFARLARILVPRGLRD